MSHFRTEGIVIDVLNFKERDQILTLFSSDQGVQKFFCKGRKAQPLTKIEIVYRMRRSNLHSCLELSILSHYLELRKDLSVLNAAGQIVRAILKTQLPGKSAPLLYQLFGTYLAQFSRAADPELLKYSFFLKLLKHEGGLADVRRCGTCQKTLAMLFFSGGEGFCKEHTPSSHIAFDEEESMLFIQILEMRNLSEILSFCSSGSFKKKLEILMREFFSLQVNFENR